MRRMIKEITWKITSIHQFIITGQTPHCNTPDPDMTSFPIIYPTVNTNQLLAYVLSRNEMDLLGKIKDEATGAQGSLTQTKNHNSYWNVNQEYEIKTCVKNGKEKKINSCFHFSKYNWLERQFKRFDRLSTKISCKTEQLYHTST